MAPTRKQTETDAGQDQVQAKVDEETAKGYRGVKVDPTPNEHYTVDGVIAGKPTPETTREGRIGQHDLASSAKENA